MGSRFGGPKQIAPLGPGGSALIDYAARDATGAGFGRLVLIVRGEIAEAVESHVRNHWPGEIRPEYVRQDLEPAAVAAAAAGRVKPLGTAHALIAASAALDGPFGVANADDLYGASAFRRLGAHLASGGGHALVGYRLANTLLGDRPVNRALCEVDTDGNVTGIVEGAVHVADDSELTWRPVGAPEADARVMKGDEPVSMNLWGFTPAVLPRTHRSLRHLLERRRHRRRRGTVPPQRRRPASRLGRRRSPGDHAHQRRPLPRRHPP